MILNLNKRLLSTLIFALALLFLCINYAFYHATVSSNVHDYFPPIEISTLKPNLPKQDTTPTTATTSVKVVDEDHSDYRHTNNQETAGGYSYDDEKEGNDWCSRVAGTRYLDDLANTWAVSCSNPGINPIVTISKGGSSSSSIRDGGMICFQSQIEEEPDNFCVAKNAVYTVSTDEDLAATPVRPDFKKEDLFPTDGILPPGTARNTGAAGAGGGGEERGKKNTRPSRPYRRDFDKPSSVRKQKYYNRHTRRQFSSPWGFSQKEWLLNCSAKQDWSSGVQAPYKFRTYFSATGAGPQLSRFDMSIKGYEDEEDGNIGEEKECSGSIMLVKLEGGGNIWHTLMEVWSAMLTLDALKRAQKAKEMLFGISSGTNEDEKLWEEENIKIYIQANMESEKNASPVFGLWNVVTGKEVKDVKELKDGCYRSVILPLAGGANPFWKDHWKERNCEKSTLVDEFVTKVLKFYGAEDDDTRTPAVVDSDPKIVEEKITIRIIGRQKNRKILRLFDYVKILQKAYPDADIEITKLEKLDITEQLRMIRKTDILIGVTGAGLTHTLFLRKGAALIELTQPEPFVYFGFGNLARMIGLRYFQIQAEKREGKSGMNWQEDNVLVDEHTFIDAVGKAIAGVKTSKEGRKDREG
ncbi:hypothetical protein TWF191_006438 [Orbilia oligospora]|uniref:EGF domain-specific O-linked N-acetylglucosamine transferase n=1 Tax=Orbilia oligospora TaxID=2813651 RepID=A0A7C8UPA3_ORBOL|nr:hypothetical protein TWF191_006438 [Orbilia oligospora]